MDTKVLRDRLGAAAVRSQEPLQVFIQTAQGGVPTRRMVGVRDAVPGFDWTQGRFIIYPEEPVVVVRELPGHAALLELARHKLDMLQQQHRALFGAWFIPKAREHEWIDGFVHGVREHITRCEEQ
jgi:hypothetical protein